MVTSRFTDYAPRIQKGHEFGMAADEIGSMFHNSFGKKALPRVNRPDDRSVSQRFGQSMNQAARINTVNARQSTYDPNRFAHYGQQMKYEAGQRMGQMAKGLIGGGSPIGRAGNTGTKLDEHNNELAAASAKEGVPVNFLKAVLNRESSGEWERDGSRMWWGRPQSGGLLPFVGIFENTWRSWGCPGSAAGAQGNKQAQIDCMAKGARMLYDKAKTENPAYDWYNVFSMYFSGKWVPQGWADENGLRDTDYVNMAMQDMQKFDRMAGVEGYSTPAQAGGGTAGGKGLSTIWGGKGDRDLSYGFNAPNNLGLYRYGTKYGMDGNGHTGVDIPMDIGEIAYSPVSGTVVCACSGNGSGADGGGCLAFSDIMGQGCGRIEVKLDNGHTIIFGHMSTANVQVGQRINAGQPVGGVGGMNGSHVHLEYRIPDPSTPSGWRIVDPTPYVSGASVQGASMGQGEMQQMPYTPDVPWQGWKGRSLSQTAQFQQNAYRPVSSWRM